MGRPCSVCQHPARKAIEASVHAGTSLGEAAALHVPLSKAAIGRHMKDHTAPITCEAAPDPLGFLSSPPPPALPSVRVRERPGFSVQPVSLSPPTPADNVVPFPAAPPAPTELEIEKREATPLAVAILLHHGYGLPEIMKRFGLGEGKMSTLLAELEDAYTGQATGSCSTAIIGRNLWKCEYAIAELENDYQTAKRQGRHRHAHECRRLLLEERRELRSMHREYGITRPLHPDELHSDYKGRRDRNDILAMVEQTINGVFLEPEPEPVRKPRLTG